MPNRNWTRDELILAMNLYCRLPFGRLHRRNPEVIQLAAAIDRSTSSVAMKLCNLASLDPAHQARGVRGLSGASAADRAVWNEFQNDWTSLAIESERLREAATRSPVPSDRADPPSPTFTGPLETQRPVPVRLAQRFFRRAVLASFQSRCCITGIEQRELLIASHIVPWSTHPEHRANPCNGLCLSRLHDGAFDRGLIAVDEEYRLVLSPELRHACANTVLRGSFLSFEGKPIALPHRFLPDSALLTLHRETIFRHS